MNVRNDNKENEILIFSKKALSGSLAGLVTKTICAPVERLKTILQTNYSHEFIIKNSNQRIDRTTAAYITVKNQEGMYYFWRGNLTNCIRYSQMQAINFSTKDSIRIFTYKYINFNDNGFLGNLLINFFCGGIAGVISTSIQYPLELAKTRLQADVKFLHAKQKWQFKGIYDCLSKIYSTDGIRGLYRGYVISVIGMFFYRGFYFGIFDTGRSYMKDDASLLEIAIMANISTLTTTSLQYPYDTILVRTMMQSYKQKTEIQYTNFKDSVRKIYQQEKIYGFYRGVSLAQLRSSLGSITLISYDLISNYILKRN